MLRCYHCSWSCHPRFSCSTSAATASAAVSSTAVSSAATSADDQVQELTDALDEALANPFSAQPESVDKLESHSGKQ